jgi:hypothetical protein
MECATRAYNGGYVAKQTCDAHATPTTHSETATVPALDLTLIVAPQVMDKPTIESSTGFGATVARTEPIEMSVEHVSRNTGRGFVDVPCFGHCADLPMGYL